MPDTGRASRRFSVLHTRHTVYDETSACKMQAWHVCIAMQVPIFIYRPTHRSKESLVATFEEEQSVKSRTEVLFDSTGMFHWCSALPMAAVTKVQHT